jgi:hypothetical protein
MAPQKASFYGPNACISTFRAPLGTCIVQTKCKNADISNFDVGITCVDKRGAYTQHLFGIGKFALNETFDTAIECERCLGVDSESGAKHEVDASEPESDLAAAPVQSAEQPSDTAPAVAAPAEAAAVKEPAHSGDQEVAAGTEPAPPSPEDNEDHNAVVPASEEAGNQESAPPSPEANETGALPESEESAALTETDPDLKSARRRRRTGGSSRKKEIQDESSLAQSPTVGGRLDDTFPTVPAKNSARKVHRTLPPVNDAGKEELPIVYHKRPSPSTLHKLLRGLAN